jgi:hypothetical protein
MPTQEIPRSEWVSFFNDFSNRHRGWLVTLEIMTADLGDQTEVRDLPLEGITAELNERGADHIQIVAGRSPDSHLSDTIPAPRRVWLKQSEQMTDEALEIETEGEKALLRFRTPIPPEFVDGILTI